MKQVQDCNVAPMCSASPPTHLFFPICSCSRSQTDGPPLEHRALSLHQHEWRLHAALRSRHAEESSMAVRPLPVQSICARPRTSLATCHNARTHISPTSLYVKLPSKVTITYTTVPVFVDRIRRRMHNGCCNQATRIKVVNSRNFCIDASPHEWLAAKPHGKCKIPYHESRYLRVRTLL